MYNFTTGKGTWYIKIATAPTSYTVITLSPGEFPDVTGYIPDGTTIISIAKTDPMSIIAKHDLNVDIDLAPDAIKQIGDSKHISLWHFLDIRITVQTSSIVLCKITV